MMLGHLVDDWRLRQQVIGYRREVVIALPGREFTEQSLDMPG